MNSDWNEWVDKDVSFTLRNGGHKHQPAAYQLIGFSSQGKCVKTTQPPNIDMVRNLGNDTMLILGFPHSDTTNVGGKNGPRMTQQDAKKTKN